MKRCSKCGLEKEESEFYRENICNSCRREYNRKYDKKYRKSVKRVEYLKKYYKSDWYITYQKKYHKSGKSLESSRKRSKKYRESKEGIEYYKEYQKKYRKSVQSKEYHKKYRDDRYNNDFQYKLSRVLRVRLSNALRGDFKSGSAVRDLGCTILELKIYLEERFKPGMNWSNYGKWHIDHKYPLSKVDLTDREQLLKVCHYTNLQPLWAEENIKKGNKILDF